MKRTSCYLTIADEHGYVLDTIEDLEEYDLSKPLAWAKICETIQSAIESRLLGRRGVQTPRPRG